MTGRTVSFATLGCRLNQVDTQEIQAALEARGFRTVPLDAPADVVLVNTCTVTSRADFSDRQMIHRAVRGRRGARIVVTGCWAQTDPDAVARVRGVDLVVGNADKPRLPDLLEELLARPEDLDPTPRRCVSDIGTERVLAAAPLARINGRSRIFVKIQDGCQHRCAFCIVPFARGPSRSREPKAVLDQIRLLVEGGYPEVVLTGVDLGHYGHDLYPRSSLAALLREMIEIPGLRWVRLSSVLPAYFTPELIELITGSPLIAPHLHIPLQSGSDRVLRRMRRPYTVGMYRRLVERLASAIPALGLGADVIVGFPGETDADFAETRALVEALPFSYLHVFAYSDRRGTEAARLGGHVGARLVTARSRELRGLGQAKSLAFRRGLVGTTRELLVLETRDRQSGHLVGLTGNYVEVVFDGPAGLMRQLVTVRLIGVDGTRTLGELEAPSDL
ncbi:MAG: tRNA (N(6)-L-threonylcarbamoyladenosine(37)-C(2))-methylthiotransferase MtaB [Candidatus Rokubacteria bacterium 13_1_40CM_69_27]|nr:MAG: tRNA (N(6)-L-threonylcarbamoyladenosine(37)-C(2))-methylthiotransferase MtaB [Candidatus Rokubacteria bacterium 13_1_40CM_69_27]OLC36447.1 MAG: tRNA (N(6)-L-threonylcarbamoyladenosine(37)-C(2))-methylthiotransferase MtaB [Candidatus Rokubacteria bacterium 13_1_40CM_4_69_5]